MNTQDKLVGKTTTVIDKHGYQNLSLRKLTATPGLTTGAFYKHFKSKDALYEKVAIELSRNFIDKVSLPDNAAAQEKLPIIVENFCQYVDQHNNLAEFSFFNSTTLKVFSTKKSEYDFLDKMKVLVNELNPKKSISNQDPFIQVWSSIQGYAVLANKKIVEYDEDLVKGTLDKFLQQKREYFMDCLIIYCHPYDKSFNHAVLKNIGNNSRQNNKDYKLIDLYKDGFVPTYDLEEMRLFHTEQAHDPLVKKYLSQSKEAPEVIFITPFWWDGTPGTLKGFIDKVMKEGQGLSHTVTRTGTRGELTNVKHIYVFITSTSPAFYLKLFLGNDIKKIFINKTLKQLGMQDRHWYNFGGASTSSVDRCRKYLDKIAKMNL